MLNTDKTNENYFDDDVRSQYQSTQVIVVLFILHVDSSMSRVVCLEGAPPDFHT